MIRKINNTALLLAFVFSVLANRPMNLRAASFSVDYSYQPSSESLRSYGFSILDIQAKADLTEGHALGKEFYCYISVGEVGGDAPYLPDVKALNISLPQTNEQWNSYYVDVADPRWADYVINVLGKLAVDKGFDGFFLDTVDTAEALGASDPGRASAYHSGMVKLIKGLNAAYPQKKIIMNRGFVVFDDVKTALQGVLVEELFQRYDYSARSPDQVNELLQRIAPITAAGLPVYIVDYSPPNDLDLANRIAEKIASLGFYPAVITQEMDGTVLAPRAHAPPLTVQNSSPGDPPTLPSSPPSIISSPSNASVIAGRQVTFQVIADGTPPLIFQWLFDGAEIIGATNSSLTLPNVQSGDAGEYSVRVSNSLGSVNSATARLTVLTPPVITSQPQGQSVVAGTDVTFNIFVASDSPVSYQWKYNGIGMDGERNATLVLTNVQPSDVGKYNVVVTNSAGSVKSLTVPLSVKIIDSDGDGMPDDWEIAHGLNPNDPSDAALDLDQDGLTNLQEYVRGKDPRDPHVLGPGTFCIDFRYAPSTKNFWAYEYVILSPYAKVDLSQGHAFGKKFFAYISVGEIAGNAQYLQQAKNARIPFLSQNTGWNSFVVDLANPGWSTFVVNKLASLAVKEGYDGFFLDTMDSYTLASDASQSEQEAGLVYLIKKLKKAYPDKDIITNRGFPIFNQIKNLIDGMLIESLFQKCNFSSDTWEAQSQSGTEWLLGQIAPVKAAHLPVFIVDYVDPARLDIASKTAERIDNLGFSPLIVAKDLDGTVLAPLPKLETVAVQNGTVHLKFKARAGKSYSVQYSDALIGGRWSKLGDVESGTTTRIVELTDQSDSAHPARVYRLVTPKAP